VAQNKVELKIVNPVATPVSHVEKGERHPPAKRGGSLDGKTVALYWNGKQNGPHALDRSKEKLAAQYKDIKFIDVIGEKGGSNRYLSDQQLEMLVKEADAVVATTAD
jgi:hypothetical protein